MPSRVVCFVCGSLGGEYGQLLSRPPCKGERTCTSGGPENIQGAYFPFLEHHDPPQGCRPPDSDGVVDSCRVCHAFLTQQWANYERSNTPAVKRLYWLKRLDDGQFTGAEMKLQGEYMAQVMGLQYQPSSDIGGGGILSRAVSPEPKERLKVSSGRSASRDSNGSSYGRKRSIQEDAKSFSESGDVLDLSVAIKSEPTLPKQAKKHANESLDKHAIDERVNDRAYRNSPYQRGEKLSQPYVKPDPNSFMCYTCGNESNTGLAKYVSSRLHAPGEPYFPFLERLSPCEGASPLTPQGLCQVCDHCFTTLCHQWLAYEQHGTPSSARIFRINDLFFSNDASLSMNGSVIGQSKEKKEYYDTRIEKDTHTSLYNKRRESDLKEETDAHVDHKGLSICKAEVDDHNTHREVCYLCSQLCSPVDMCPLYTTTAKSAAKVDQMYFPFISELRRPQGARPLNPDGSVRVCQSCNSNLKSQWQLFQSEGVPVLKRRYSLLPSAVSGGPLRLSPQSLARQSISPNYPDLSPKQNKPEVTPKPPISQPLHIEIGKDSPRSPCQELLVNQAGNGQEPRQNVHINSSVTALPTTTSSSLNTIPHPLQQACERPKKVCFLCGEKCLSIRSQVLHSVPAQHEVKAQGNAAIHTFPFFPFIKSREPAPNAEPMSADGSVVTCSYCYYSLLNQWRDYEEGTRGVDTASNDRWHRKYSLTEFACYVCGHVDVSRCNMRTLEIRKFSFLREHRAPAQALVMWGGECVGCCSWCHYSLTHQLAEYERLGLPPELHKYNWTGAGREQQQNLHVDENSCDTQDSIHDNAVPVVANEQADLSFNALSENEDSNLGPPVTSKPLMPMLGSTPAGLGKLPPKTAAVPPLNHHQNSSNGGGSNSALRTSGFAAALRKLAHQAKDSTDDPGLKQTGSPPDNHSPRDGSAAKLRGQGSSHLNFPTWPMSSAPVVTIAPTQAQPSHGLHPLEARRNHERVSVPSSRSGPHYELQQSHHHHTHHHHASPGGKLDTSREHQQHHHHHSRQTPPSSHHGRDEDWIKDGRSSRSSSRVTPQAPTSSPPGTSSSSSNYPLTSQALPTPTSAAVLNDFYTRGLHVYRPEEEALRLGLAGGLPYGGLDPAAYAAYAAAAAAYHPALIQQQAALAAQAAHSPYRLDDPLLLERYRLLQASSPYFSFPGLPGLPSVAGLGLHPALAAASATRPPDFPAAASVAHLGLPELLQRYPHPYLPGSAPGSQGHPVLDPMLDPRLATAAMLDRVRLEEERNRELREQEKSRENMQKDDESTGNCRGREPGERDSSRPHISESLAECKSNGIEPLQRDSRPLVDNLRDTHKKASVSRDGHYRGEMSKDFHSSSFARPKFSPQSSNTHVIKPYDRAADQRLSQSDGPSSSFKPVLDSHHSYQPDQGPRHLPTLYPSTASAKPGLLSPSHANISNHRPSTTTAAQAPRKEKSDFFRPFDDVVKSDREGDQPAPVIKQSSELEKEGTKKDGWHARSSHPTLPSSNTNRSHILSIPSVKVHPQYWSHGDLPHGSNPSTASSAVMPTLPVPPPLTALSLAKSATAAIDQPPPLVPSSRLDQAIPITDSNDSIHLYQRSITDRIEKFDFKSLAREFTQSGCNASTPTDPALQRPTSKLDKRQIALKQRKRKLIWEYGEEETNEEDDEEMTMTRLTMLTRASPIPLDTDNRKMNLLEYLGLTTQRRKRELAVKKERRRRRRLRLASLSPVRHDQDVTNTFRATPDPTTEHKWEEDCPMPQQGKPSKEKSHFLCGLGLQFLSHRQREELKSRRKLKSHWRRMNSWRRFCKKNSDSKSGALSVPQSSTSSSSSSSSPAITHHKHHLSPIVSKDHPDLVSAGLATQVRPLQLQELPQVRPSHVTAPSSQGADNEPKARSDRHLSTDASAASGLPKENYHYRYMAAQQLVPPVPPLASLGIVPPLSKETDSQSSKDTRATHPPNLSQSTQASAHGHAYPHGSLPSVGRPNQSSEQGISHSTMRGAPRYQLLQASAQDMEEAARRMERHMAMWINHKSDEQETKRPL